MAFLLAGLTALFYGSSHFAGGMATRRAPVLAVTFWANLVGLGIVTCASVMHVASRDSANLADHAWGALSGVAGLVGVTLYFQGLARGQMAVVAPLSAVTQAVVPFLFGILIGERHGVPAWLGVAVAVPALWLTVHRRGRANRPAKAVYGLAAGLAFSLFFVAISRISPEAGFWPLVTLRASGPGPAGHRVRRAAGGACPARRDAAAGSPVGRLHPGRPDLFCWPCRSDPSGW